MKTPNWLERAARQSTKHLWTLGSVLDDYRNIERATPDQLAAFLGCSVDTLDWLSLCRKPTPERFADDIARIAQRFNLNPSTLAQVVRRVDVVHAFRRPAKSREGESLLIAARDRKNEEKGK